MTWPGSTTHGAADGLAAVPGGGSRPMPRPGELVLFLAAALASVVLGVARYRDAMSSPSRGDLTGIFLPAARAVLQGRSPYDITGYVYSPLWAVMLAPLAPKSWGVGLATALLIGCGVVACWICAVACTRNQPRWQTGLMSCVCVITLLWSWPTLIGLRALRPELLVLLVLVGAALTRGARSGLLLGMAAVLKTWPAALVLWLLPARTRRLRRLAGFATAGLVALALAWCTGGARDVTRMVHVASESSLQPFVAVSVPGAARLFFRDNPLAEPLSVSTPLYVTAMVLGFALLVCLLGLVVRRPGTGFIALFNLVFLVQLALPVSHYSYFVLALPALWFWLAHALTERDDTSMVASVTLVLWWILTARNPDIINQAGATSLVAYSFVFVPTVIAAAVSVIAAARLPRQESPGAPTAGNTVREKQD